jgi:periplasmic divalent cation tolerance protein
MVATKISNNCILMLVITIITTLHKKKDAIRIGKGLLKSHLIACYNLWPIESAYWWKGSLLEEPETMMLLKTQAQHFDKIAEYIKDQSGYEIPDIFSLKPNQTLPIFNDWVQQETTGAPNLI